MTVHRRRPHQMHIVVPSSEVEIHFHGPDEDYQPYRNRIYLSLSDGSFVHVFDSDDDAEVEGFGADENRATCNQIAEAPDSFIEIPRPSHGDVHDWLKRFLREGGRLSEYPHSIGRWLNSVDQEDKYAWRDFQALRLHEHVVAACDRAGVRLSILGR